MWLAYWGTFCTGILKLEDHRDILSMLEGNSSSSLSERAARPPTITTLKPLMPPSVFILLSPNRNLVGRQRSEK